ncbi:O-antigen ligase family protein [Flavobacteriaceae bacterium 14752]|uniref:O-antigen ligase family protein n=1 Tax=Mesohalobacter salilacus TaxID=2491711 RepID=UPI000F63A1BF|nr:O-antigen ligase domain-containing protein [Flavobacteriaceae bacterium 14752]
MFDYFPFTESWLDYRNGRLSSVSYAPPVFGMYLMTIAGWMFSYILTHKGLKSVIPTILVVVFVFLSGSRSALFVVIVQLLVFLFYLIKKRKYHSNLIKIAVIAFILSTPFLILKGKVFGEYVYDKVTSFDLDDGTHSISNKSRLGMIYTSGLVFLENPIKGVGFGQVAYEARSLYPAWATKNNWEFEHNYLDNSSKVFPPSYNIYTRLLAETGIIGFSLFTLFIIILIYVCYKKVGLKNEETIFYLTLLVSFTGYAFNWLQVDTFRVFGFWICLALLIATTKNQLKFKINKN